MNTDAIQYARPETSRRGIFRVRTEWWIAAASLACAVVATVIAFRNGSIVAFGDAESHLNIAKRVIQSLTPGFAQLGGIWLPLPHLLLVPFVYFDFLWRTGLAGSIVSGICYIVSCVYIYKLMKLIVDNEPAAVFAAVIFMINPNVLYMQATPMTELTLIVFFILSSYYFIRFIKDRSNILMLVLAAFFGFCASLSRYDGWGLVLMEAGIIFLMYVPLPALFRRRKQGKSDAPQDQAAAGSGMAANRSWNNMEGMVILFSTLALFGIIIWFVWGWLILGDPLYFTHSQFSADSQQQSWLAQGELPAYKNIVVSLVYYAYTSMVNVGTLIAELALIGLIFFLFRKGDKNRWYIFLVLSVPFIFNVATLYLGQSIIFIPGLTPATYHWDLFNVRYGVMMVPFVAICLGYLFYRFPAIWARSLVALACVLQSLFFIFGYAPVITYADATTGLSSEIAQVPDAQRWLDANYDYGLVLEDDYSRTISLIRTPIPMQDVIYVGNKPYWDESLKAPEMYARWIIMQKNDAVWTAIYDDPVTQARLFKYFNKVYTSDNILIFKRISNT